MQIFLFISLVVAAIAVIFALQNTAVVEITFLFWSFEGSLALVLLLSLALGVLASFFASLPRLIRGSMTTRSQQKKITELESRLTEQQSRLADAQQRLQQLENPAELQTADAELPTPADQETEQGKSLWQS